MASQSTKGLYDPRNEHDACGVGFVANIKGRKSHDIIQRGLEILVNLDHRGAVGADPLMGDGAGCMIQMPDALLRDWAAGHGLELPAPGRYGVAMCFLPMDEKARAVANEHFEHFVAAEGQTLLAWRDVGVDTDRARQGGHRRRCRSSRRRSSSPARRSPTRMRSSARS